MLIRINIKMVLETGISAPKVITRFSTRVSTATATMMMTESTASRFRRLRSSTG